MINILAETSSVTNPETWFAWIDKFGFALVVAVVLLAWILAEKRSIGKELTSMKTFVQQTLVGMVEKNAGAIERNTAAMQNVADVIHKCKRDN